MVLGRQHLAQLCVHTIIHDGSLILTVAGIMITARLDDGLDGLWAAILIAAVSIGYMLSRGLAKSGTRYVDHD